MLELSVILQVQKLYSSIARIGEKLPAIKRQTLGRRMEETTLSLMEYLIMAKYAPKAHKGAYLIKTVALTEMLQFYLRILSDEKLANETTIFQLQAKAVEIGRQIGGWRKSVS